MIKNQERADRAANQKEPAVHKQPATIEVARIDFDKGNPRIRPSLEDRPDADISDAEVCLQLEHAMSRGGSGSPGWRRLRNSIRACGKADQRITVVEVNGRYLCIDGNTRVAIYRDLELKKEPGNWKTIEADIITGTTTGEIEEEMERTRIVSHIVGPREWSPYRRAKYLHRLRFEKRLDWKEIVELCGGSGNESTLRDSIAAYELMEDYRQQVPEGNFKEDRFSAFEEIVKLRMVAKLEDHGKTMEDFNRWVEKGVLRTDAEVRELRKVLNDEQAREELEREEPRSLEKAIHIVKAKEARERSNSERTKLLREAGVLELARWLAERLENTTMKELRAMESRQGEVAEIADKLYDAASELRKRTTP